MLTLFCDDKGVAATKGNAAEADDFIHKLSANCLLACHDQSFPYLVVLFELLLTQINF
jgi:hypothetical protein